MRYKHRETYEKEQSQHNTLKGSLTWQLGDHELKTGIELRNNTIRYYRIGAAERLAYYFDVNAPYAPDQDRNGYVDSLGVVVANNPDGISDYLQDGSDSWNPLNSDGDPYFGSLINFLLGALLFLDIIILFRFFSSVFRSLLFSC